MKAIPKIELAIVDVRDLADLHIRAMEGEAANGERFLALSDGVMTLPEIAEFLRAERPEVTHDMSSKVLPDWIVRVSALLKEGSVITPYFVYSDHLGSILTLTNTSGTVIAAQNFDAWGRNRNPDNWTYTSIPSVPDWLYRGFTGHEYMAQYALINMNGRLYDPMIGRMISPDNFVPLPWSTQGYNRYQYCGNNPLLYTDPDGNLFGIDDLIRGAIGAVVGGVINVVTNIGHVGNVFDVFKYFGSGAVGGFVGGVTLSSGLASAITGGINAAIEGGGIKSIAQGAALGFVGGAVGGAVAGKVGGALTKGFNIPGGIINKGISGLSGGFAGGAAAGGIGAALNGQNVLHGVLEGGWTSAKYGGALGAAMGGLTAVNSNQNIWTGVSKPVPLYSNSSVKVENVEPQGFAKDDGSPLNAVDRSNKSIIKHIFKTSGGHVNPQTAASQGRYLDLFESVANDPNNLVAEPVIREFITIDAYNNGVQVYAQTFNSGQIWVFVRNGSISDAGVNQTPR